MWLKFSKQKLSTEQIKNSVLGKLKDLNHEAMSHCDGRSPDSNLDSAEQALRIQGTLEDLADGIESLPVFCLRCCHLSATLS